MLKKHFSAACAAAFILAGCAKVNPDHATSDDELQVLTISVASEASTAGTKVYGAAADDARINNVQAFVFNRHGLFETSATSTTSVVQCSCTAGEKQVIVLVNADTETEVRDIADLSARTVDLADCDVDNLVMVGQGSVTVGAATGVPITVKRLASKVVLGDVYLSFADRAHSGLSFELKSVYLMNAAGHRAYIDDNVSPMWYNEDGYDAATCPSFLYDEITGGVLQSGGTQYSTDHYFYCYPNSTSKPTRMVIEAEIEGQTYYYPIVLDNLAPNNSYNYTVTIKSLGLDFPDMTFDKKNLNVTVTATPWHVNPNRLEM